MKRLYILLSIIIFASVSTSSFAITSYSLALNGSNQYVETKYSSSISSLELWLKASELKANQVICGQESKGKTESGNWFLAWDSENQGSLKFQMIKSSKSKETIEFQSKHVFQKNQWYHIALIANGNDILLYINGKEDSRIATSLIPGASLNTSPFSIGGCTTKENHACFSGTIDEVRIWAYARSQEEINQQMKSSLNKNEYGLLAYYPFNTPETAQITDCSENAYHGQINSNCQSHYQSDYTIEVLGIQDLSGISIQLQRNESNKVQIDWTSTTHNSSTIFTIQRKNITGSFTTIAVVNANTNSQNNGFSFIDESSSRAAYIYRIKQMNQDGAILESNTYIINELAFDVKFYPSSNNKNIYLNVPDTQFPFWIGLSNENGKIIFENTYKESGFVMLDLKQVPKGSYTIEVQSGSQKTSKKIILDDAIEIAAF